MNKLSTERAIDALDTVRAYYASLTAGYPKGKDCKGIGDVTCSEIANSCLMAIKALEQESRPMEKFESAKDHIYKLAGDYKCWDERLSHEEALELSRMLEQQPCEATDAISRQAVIDTLTKTSGIRGDALKALYDLPPVTPQQKMGKWIAVQNDEMETVGYYCSECDLPMETEYRTKFCSQCGSYNGGE